MGHPSRNMEDIVTEGDLNYAELVQEVSVENFNMCPRDSFYILDKYVATFCPCLKSLPEDSIKRLRLIALTKEGTPIIDFVL